MPSHYIHQGEVEVHNLAMLEIIEHKTAKKIHGGNTECPWPLLSRYKLYLCHSNGQRKQLFKGNKTHAAEPHKTRWM